MDDFGNYYSHGWTHPVYSDWVEPHFHAYTTGTCIHAYGVSVWQDFY